MKKFRIIHKITAAMLSLCMITVSGMCIDETTFLKVNAADRNEITKSMEVERRPIDTSASSTLSTVSNMKTDVNGSVAGSYFYKSNQKYYMVFHDEKKLHIDIYDTNMNKISTKTIDDELKLFGGFYSGKKYNFVVYGKSYSNEDKETYRIVKYDKKFKKIASLSIDGDKTYTRTPFDGGSSSFAERDDILIYYTSRIRQGDSDGMPHQSNVTLRINEEDMTVADNYLGAVLFPVNYGGHAFRNIVKTDTDGSEIYATLTDRSPCCGVSVMDLKVNSQYSGKYELKKYKVAYTTELEGAEYDPYSIYNETDAEVNGLSITDSSYIVVGEYYDNVFVGAVNKQTGNVTKKMLTKYNEYSEYGLAQESKLVQIDKNTSIVLWQSTVDGIYSVHYVKVGQSGEIEGKIKTAFDTVLSDCQPIYDEGKIRWYTVVDGQNTLYSISDLNFDGNFESLGSKMVEPSKIWNESADTSWYKSSQNKFTISTAEQLAGLAKLVNLGNDMKNKSFVLANDLYLNSDEDNQVFTPIASRSSGVEFSGIFDGNKHTIYRLYRIESDDSTEGGLFGTIGKYGIVRNLTIDQSYIRQNAGALAKINYGTIMFCENNGQIVSASQEDSKTVYVGGIVGENYGMIYGCANKGRIIGYHGCAGGIAGYIGTVNGCVKACYNSGCVSSGGLSSGGIVGEAGNSSTVEDCSQIGLTQGSVIGGFVNYANYVGGIAGMINTAYIFNCVTTSYSKENEVYVHSSDPICGNVFSGMGRNLIFDCYSLYDTKNGTKMTLEEMLSNDFVEKLNSATDFFETRLNKMWVKGDFLPVTIAQRADELKLYQYYPSVCVYKSEDKIGEDHFGYAKAVYHSDNERIATIDSQGNIIYNGGVGTVTITLTIPETEVSTQEVHTFQFTKYGISFKNAYEKINKGKSLQLSLDKNYKTTPNEKVEYLSNNDSVVKVSSTGKITGVSVGSATITATLGNDKTTCLVYVTDNRNVLTDGSCGKNLKYSLSTDGILTFTGSGEMTSAPWTDYNRLIKKIVFSKGMTNIYPRAFVGSQVKSIVIPSNIKIIGESSFKDTALEAVTLSNGVEEIGKEAFSHVKIKEIIFPKSIQKFGDEAFEKCYFLEKITSNSTRNTIYNAFDDKNTMKNVEVIYGIAGSGANSLADYFKIKFIPLSNPNFTVSVDSSKLIINKYIGNSANVIVPSEIDGVTVAKVAKNCFVGNPKISSITIPDDITSEISFRNCKNLTSVHIPEKLTEIFDSMFFGCSALKEITLPKGIEKIGEDSFNGCSSLTEIILPKSVKNIGRCAFYNCKRMRKIDIPKTLEGFEAYAFIGCDQLKCLILPVSWDSVSIFGLMNDAFTTIYSDDELIHRVCSNESLLSNLSCFSIPTEKTTLTDNGVSVTGYLPPNTTMTVTHENGIYAVRFMNNGKEIEPCGEITVTILNNKNQFVMGIYSDNTEEYIHSDGAKGRYTFTTQANRFKFTDALNGDTNGDGSVDIADALMIARYDAGLVELDSSQLSVSDVNKDNSVDIADALMVARYDAGLIDNL